ncbi:hypothetical protein JXA80_10475, partial [bacterium]|nr:hypothetical protein [candidate division CSSED10-310 bacterium]
AGFFDGVEADSTGTAWERFTVLAGQGARDAGWGMPIIGLLLLIPRERKGNGACSGSLPLLVISATTAAGAAMCANFDIRNWDFQGYLLPAIAGLGLWVPLTIARSLPQLSPVRVRMLVTATVVAAILPLTTGTTGGPRSLAGRTDAATAGRCALDDPEPNAMVLTRSDFRFILDYLQAVERYRDDVRTVSRNFLIRDAGSSAMGSIMAPWSVPPVPAGGMPVREYLRSWLRLNRTERLYWELADDMPVIDNLPARMDAWFVEVEPPDRVMRKESPRWEVFLSALRGPAGCLMVQDRNCVEQMTTVFYNRGTFSLNRGDPGMAVELLRMAVMFDPKGVKALNNLGVALAGVGRYGDASEAFREVLVRDPMHPGARQNIEALQERIEP